MPEQMVNRRWLTRQMAGAYCVYRSMAKPATTAQIMKEIMPEVSAC